MTSARRGFLAFLLLAAFGAGAALLFVDRESAPELPASARAADASRAPSERLSDSPRLDEEASAPGPEAAIMSAPIPQRAEVPASAVFRTDAADVVVEVDLRYPREGRLVHVRLEQVDVTAAAAGEPRVLREADTDTWRALFTGIPPHVFVTASAVFDGVTYRTKDTASVELKPGATETLKIEISKAPHFRFQVLDADGSACASRRLSIGRFGWMHDKGVGEVDRPRRFSSTGDVESDARAFVDVSMDAKYGPNDAFCFVIESGSGPDLGRARIDVTTLMQPGVHDLAPVRLERARLVVAGSVLGPEGEAVPRASVKYTASKASRAESDEFVANRDWESDDTGQFAIYDFGEPSRYSIFADRSPYARSETLTFGERREGVVLRLGGAGSIAGSLDVPAELSDHLTLSLRRVPDGRADANSARGPSRETDSRDEAVKGSGGFKIRDLRAGRWDLSLRKQSLGELAFVPGIVVTAGKTSTDPRLADLKITTRFVRIEIEVVDALTGANLPDAFVAIRPRAEDRSQRVAFGIPRGSDRPSLWVPAIDGANVAVSHPKYRSVVIEHARESRTVRLVPEPGVTLRM